MTLPLSLPRATPTFWSVISASACKWRISWVSSLETICFCRRGSGITSGSPSVVFGNDPPKRRWCLTKWSAKSKASRFAGSHFFRSAKRSSPHPRSMCSFQSSRILAKLSKSSLQRERNLVPVRSASRLSPYHLLTVGSVSKFVSPSAFGSSPTNCAALSASRRIANLQRQEQESTVSTAMCCNGVVGESWAKRFFRKALNSGSSCFVPTPEFEFLRLSVRLRVMVSPLGKHKPNGSNSGLQESTVLVRKLCPQLR